MKDFSSARYAQSNGQIERAVQFFFNLLKKCKSDKSDFYLVLLEYRNTPLDSNLGSPADILMNKTLRTRLTKTEKSLATSYEVMIVKTGKSYLNDRRVIINNMKGLLIRGESQLNLSQVTLLSTETILLTEYGNKPKFCLQVQGTSQPPPLGGGGIAPPLEKFMPPLGKAKGGHWPPLGI